MPAAAAGFEIDGRFNAVQRNDDVLEAAAGPGADKTSATGTKFDAVQGNDNAFETA